MRSLGRRSEIYVESVHPSLSREAVHLDRLEDDRDAALLLHVAIHSRAATVFRAAVGRRRGIVFHNITPARFFVGISRINHDRVRDARRALPELAGVATLGIALSEYSRRELVEAGFASTAVCPLAVTVPVRVGPRATSSPPVVLCVGRVVPNKRWELAIQATACLRRSYSTARLDLIGSSKEMEPYAAALDRMAARLNVHLRRLGHVNDAELERAYAGASALLLPSAHEGLGLPLVEAMARSVPVVATAHGAIPETLAGAGLLCDDDPLMIGEALGRVIGSPAVAATLAARGRTRAAAFSAERLTAAVRESILPWADAR